MNALTHAQFEALRPYESGHPKWMGGKAPSSALTQKGYLRREPGSGETRADSFYTLTAAGAAALVAYRVRWGIPAPAPDTDALVARSDENALDALTRALDR